MSIGSVVSRAVSVRPVLSRALWLALMFVAAATWPSVARAQSSPGAGGPDSWVGQLSALGRWMRDHEGPPACEAHCFTLQRMRFTGSAREGQIEFDLTGDVLADGPVAVPLFGPPDQVRIEDATENGHAASIGFEDSHYYLYTAARHFALHGFIRLGDDRTLEVAGPLNTLDIDLSQGHVVEGARLAGLSATTLHFDTETQRPANANTQPAVFQLSRAIRVGREIQFEYRLSMRAATDLGVVRVPLRYGERVADVTGAASWRVEAGELVLSIDGRNTDVTVTGSMPAIAAFEPDTRSGYEWWLIESDPEHRVTVAGEPRQVDPAQSPIARTQVTSRLFLVRPGQRLTLTVQTLQSAEVLAAVVRSHTRTLVITQRGELVSDEWLAYDNNGLDYVTFTPAGRAVFLATDDEPERVLQAGPRSSEVLIPLRTGAHTAHLQSLGQTHLGLFGGRLQLPASMHSLTTSSTRITLGLPRFMHPIALVGGDRSRWFVPTAHVMAVGFAFALAWFVARDRRRKLALGVGLAGLWFASPAGFAALLTLGAAAKASQWAVRIWTGRARHMALVGVAFGCAAAFGWALPRVEQSCLPGSGPSRTSAPTTSLALATRSDNGLTITRDSDGRARGNSNERGRFAENAQQMYRGPQFADGNTLNAALDQTAVRSIAADFVQGVAPVALPLPAHSVSVTTSRELVARRTSFRPTLVYVTDLGLLPFALLWVLALVLLARWYRADAAAAWTAIRARIPASGT